MGRDGGMGRTAETLFVSFIITEGHGSVVNGMKHCVAFIRLLNLSEPQFPTAAPRGSFQGDGLLLFGFGLGKESPNLPPFSARSRRAMDL